MAFGDQIRKVMISELVRRTDPMYQLQLQVARESYADAQSARQRGIALRELMGELGPDLAGLAGGDPLTEEIMSKVEQGVTQAGMLDPKFGKQLTDYYGGLVEDRQEAEQEVAGRQNRMMANVLYAQGLGLTETQLLGPGYDDLSEEEQDRRKLSMFDQDMSEFRQRTEDIDVDIEEGEKLSREQRANYQLNVVQATVLPPGVANALISQMDLANINSEEFRSLTTKLAESEEKLRLQIGQEAAVGQWIMVLGPDGEPVKTRVASAVDMPALTENMFKRDRITESNWMQLMQIFRDMSPEQVAEEAYRIFQNRGVVDAGEAAQGVAIAFANFQGQVGASFIPGSGYQNVMTGMKTGLTIPDPQALDQIKAETSKQLVDFSDEELSERLVNVKRDKGQELNKEAENIADTLKQAIKDDPTKKSKEYITAREQAEEFAKLHLKILPAEAMDTSEVFGFKGDDRFIQTQLVKNIIDIVVSEGAIDVGAGAETKYNLLPER